MRDNPHATFLAHDCIPSKTKVELFTFNAEISTIEVDLQRGILSKTAHFVLKHFNIQCFGHAECIAIGINE